ncbi:tellurium resistance protein, partial [Streptomyces sp. YIM B13502]
MAVWDKLKDQAKALQQNQGGRGATTGQSGGTRSGGGSKAQLIGVLKTQLGSLKT